MNDRCTFIHEDQLAQMRDDIAMYKPGSSGAFKRFDRWLRMCLLPSFIM